MKRALNCALFLVCCSGGGFGGSLQPSNDLTVVLDFRGAHTIRSVSEMQREAQRIVSNAGIHLDWTTVARASQHTYSELVVVQFTGACTAQPNQEYYGESAPAPGPLASTYETDGAVQPFSLVYCDKVAASVRSAMWAGDFSRADVLMGRALGRVLVHELVHILTRSGDHARSGVEQRALSGRQLISASLTLSALDLDRLKQSLNREVTSRPAPDGLLSEKTSRTSGALNNGCVSTPARASVPLTCRDQPELLPKNSTKTGYDLNVLER